MKSGIEWEKVTSLVFLSPLLYLHKIHLIAGTGLNTFFEDAWHS